MVNTSTCECGHEAMCHESGTIIACVVSGCRCPRYRPKQVLVMHEPEGCKVQPFLSRACERGTKACCVVHGSSKPRATTDGKPPVPGFETASAPAPVDPATGQHGAYWVLPEEERAKGFVRPVRESYKHVGVPAPKNLRDLTDEEKARQAPYGYVKFEEYGPERSPVTGRFWTQAQLDKLGGCGTITTMGRALAETWARDVGYYGATFCAACRAHLPVEEFVWLDGSKVGS
jgi:hypothetical protein